MGKMCSSVAALLALSTCHLVAAGPVPVVKAPWAKGEKPELVRQKAEVSALRAGVSATDYLEFNSRLYRLRTFYDSRPQAMFYLVTEPAMPWGTYDTPGKTIAAALDEDGRGVTRTSDGFEQRIRETSAGRFEIATSWRSADAGAPGATGLCVAWENTNAWRTGAIYVTGDEGRLRFSGLPLALTNPTRAEYVTDRPGESFAVEFGRDACKRLSIAVEPNGINARAIFREPHNGRPFSFVYDAGEKPVVQDGPGTVNGTDFPRLAAMEYAHYDENGNFLVNPSFESGARYWHCDGGYNVADSVCTNEARSGSRSLRLDRPVRTFALPLEKGATYTLSFYMKAAAGHEARVAVEPVHCYGRRGQAAMPKFPTWSASAREGWKRVSATFAWPFPCGAFEFRGSGAYLDDVQIEKAAAASDYRGNPFGLELRHGGPDPYFAEAGKPIGAELLLRGPAASSGRLDVVVTDFFDRRTWSGSFPFALSATGEAGFPLPDSAFRVKGANTVRVTVVPFAGRAYADFLRFSVFAFANGTAKNRLMHQYSSLGSHTRDQLKIPESTFRMMKVTGIAPRCRAVQDPAGVYSPDLARKILKRYEEIGGYGLGYVCEDSLHGCEQKIQLIAKLAGRGFPDPRKTQDFSDEMLKALEDVTAEIVAAAPWHDLWIGPDEISSGWACARGPGGPARAAKVLMAMHRGVKRGNPKATFICYSTWGCGPSHVREYVEFFKAAQTVDPTFRFDTVDPHTYRTFYEGPKDDVDADWRRLFAALDKAGYPGMRVYSLAGGYAYPLYLQEWGDIAPWAGVDEKDAYSRLHLPGYALGWGERVATAMQLRFNLQCYRHAPRLAMSGNWVPMWIDGQTPHAPNVATAAQTELLGDATILEDVRGFAEGARAYVFDDGHGHATSVFWKFTEELDRGREQGTCLALDLRGLEAEIFDLMANPVEAEVRQDGCTVLPLSNFPVYVRVPAGRATALADAYHGSREL